MVKLSTTLKRLAADLLTNIESIVNSRRADLQKKILITECWNRLLSSNTETVNKLDDYGKCVVYGYRSMVTKHVADILTLEEFERYVYAVLTMMTNAKPGNWNEKF